MKIAAISDIHGNISAYRKVVAELNGIGAIFCAGDVVYHYRFNNELFDLLKEQKVYLVMGNHESAIISDVDRKFRTSSDIRDDNLQFIRELPINLKTRLDGKRIFMTHGSPWEPYDEYIFPGSPYFENLVSLGADIVIVGHTHFPMVIKRGNVIIINPGTLGEPRDPRYEGQLTYVVFDTENGQAEIKTFDYQDI